MKKMTLIEKVEKKYGSLKEEWVAEKGKVHETRLIRELALELKKTQQSLNHADDKVTELWRDRGRANGKWENLLNLYKRRTYLMMDHIEHMRDNIDQHVEQLEEVLAEHAMLQEQIDDV
jgi:hypothetical protein